MSQLGAAARWEEQLLTNSAHSALRTQPGPVMLAEAEPCTRIQVSFQIEPLRRRRPDSAEEQTPCQLDQQVWRRVAEPDSTDASPSSVPSVGAGRGQTQQLALFNDKKHLEDGRDYHADHDPGC